MALPGKQRFKDLDVKKKIDLGPNGVPESFSYKRKDLQILGESLNKDLIPEEFPVKTNDENIVLSEQYIATDKKGNLYECYIYAHNYNGEIKAYIGSIMSIPPK